MKLILACLTLAAMVAALACGGGLVALALFFLPVWVTVGSACAAAARPMPRPTQDPDAPPRL